MGPISLVIPIRDEEDSIEALVESIDRQARPPDEVLLVDGGSHDRTIGIVEGLIRSRSAMKLIKTDDATPGRGRNIGIGAAGNTWIALADAGMTLDERWLDELANQAGGVDIVYGNYAPDIRTFFDKCAALAYVPAQAPSGIRGKSMASSLFKKSVWEQVGGFPDLRAAEDLIFMEKVEQAGFREAHAPHAVVRWRLRPDVASTWRKFVLYSKHNVLAGRERGWHYGIVRQYAVLAPLLLLAFFHSWWWLVSLPAWLTVRTAVRIARHRYEHGVASVFNPLVFSGVAALMLLIDTATFLGWAQAIYMKTNSAK